jgi:hypothetical protein
MNVLWFCMGFLVGAVSTLAMVHGIIGVAKFEIDRALKTVKECRREQMETRARVLALRTEMENLAGKAHYNQKMTT